MLFRSEMQILCSLCGGSDTRDAAGLQSGDRRSARSHPSPAQSGQLGNRLSFFRLNFVAELRKLGCPSHNWNTLDQNQLTNHMVGSLAARLRPEAGYSPTHVAAGAIIPESLGVPCAATCQHEPGTTTLLSWLGNLRWNRGIRINWPVRPLYTFRHASSSPAVPRPVEPEQPSVIIVDLRGLPPAFG